MKRWSTTALTLLAGVGLGFVTGRASAPHTVPLPTSPKAAPRSEPSIGGFELGAEDVRVLGAGTPPIADRRAMPLPRESATSSGELAAPNAAAAIAATAAPASASATTDASPDEPTLRTRLQSASDAERAQLLGTLVASLRGADPLARAQQLNELFQANGWFGDKPGAPLDESVWRLAGDTLRELPEGAEHDSLLVTLGQQLARVRGTNALASLVSLSTLTLADESARFAGRSPDPDPAVLALMRQQLVDGATAGTLDQNAALYGAFGLGGSDASADDQRALMRLATDGCMPKVRVSGYFALATTPPSVEIDTFLVRNATSGAHVWKDRVMAWQVLRRRGREELLPASVVQELLSMWERSGATDLEQLLDD